MQLGQECMSISVTCLQAGCRVTDDVSHKRQKAEHGASVSLATSQKQVASSSSHASHTFTNHDRKMPPGGSAAGPSQPGGSTIRRVRTEPNLTPKEYLERKELERREKIRIEREREKLAREHGRVSQVGSAHFHSPAPTAMATRPVTAPPDGDGMHSSRPAERHHSDIFSNLQPTEKSGKSQRGERHHRSSGSHDLSKVHPGVSGGVQTVHGKERVMGSKGHLTIPNAAQSRADNTMKHSHHDRVDIAAQQGAPLDEKHIAARADKAQIEHPRRNRTPVVAPVVEGSVAGLDINVNTDSHPVTATLTKEHPVASRTEPVAPPAAPTIVLETAAVDSPLTAVQGVTSLGTPERDTLKIKLDLKDVKTASPVKKSSERRKELKMKIVKSSDGSTPVSDKPELKLKLKMSMPLEATTTAPVEDEEEEEGQIVSPVATPIKLVLSKDRTSGQYSSERHKHKHSGEWHGHRHRRHHRHGSDGKKHSSRKRPHSPTAAAGGPHKPQTNATSAVAPHTPVKAARHAHGAVDHRFHDNAARDTNGNHGDGGKPAVTPDKQMLDAIQQLGQLIQQSEANLQMTQHHPGDRPPPPPPPPLPSDQPPPPPPPPPP